MLNNPFYACEKYYLLIYETKKIAAWAKATPSPCSAWTAAEVAVAAETAVVAVVAVAAEYWSKRLNSRVLFSNPGEPIFLIKKEDKYWNVIIGEKIGWIIADDWLGLKLLNEK